MGIIKERAKTYALGALIALGPLQPILLTTIALVLLDMVTGILASKKRKEPIESAKLKRTVIKLLIYQLTIVISYVTMLYLTGEEIPLLKIVTSIIGLTELRSCFENLSVITGDHIFSTLTGSLPYSKRTKQREHKRESDDKSNKPD